MSRILKSMAKDFNEMYMTIYSDLFNSDLKKVNYDWKIDEYFVGNLNVN